MTIIYTAFFLRKHKQLLTMAAAIGATEAQIDELFAHGATLP